MSGFNNMFSSLLEWEVLQSQEEFSAYVKKHKLSIEDQKVLVKTARMIMNYKNSKDVSDLDITVFNKALGIKNKNDEGLKPIFEEETFEESDSIQNSEATSKDKSNKFLQIIFKLFSYRGKFKRLDYFLYGWVTPISIFMISIGISRLLNLSLNSFIGPLMFVLMFGITLPAYIKRARDVNIKPFISTLLLSFFGIFVTTYLLFEPSKNKYEKSKVGIFIGITLLLGVIISIAIPKFFKTNNQTKNMQNSKFSLYKKVCDSGDARGCNNLGVLYEKGQEVEQDYLKAKTFYKKACDSGNTLGCYNLGYLYAKGKGVNQDQLKAKNLYKKACDGGEVMGCYNLGYLYANGKGVKQNYFKAKTFYEKACEGGYVKGCTILGLLYEYGKGVKQNYFKAKTLYKKGCDGGNNDGCLRYRKLDK